MTSSRPAPAVKPGSLCEQRGFHGPFINLEKYAQFPEWDGMGDCSVCGTTRFVPREEVRRRAMFTRRPGTDAGPPQPQPEPG